MSDPPPPPEISPALIRSSRLPICFSIAIEFRSARLVHRCRAAAPTAPSTAAAETTRAISESHGSFRSAIHLNRRDVILDRHRPPTRDKPRLRARRFLHSPKTRREWSGAAASPIS